ncbi:hypothetical protein EJ05DRAFT_519875 [Pseudovirgaria hyperparasitica]|uniref:Uncharacterized protein n=1 Tax=Pseudovirgaria hyperparasitica TaxID=470096 RepID=A0A6A6VZI3_9PEZI|nr:uncharacterized protein EJ05DRAFT_519875 [Pseudovirgaria hyperparasitica]KAF2755154.1 hypothetical protein EJ05DRAFT_519875 [Pseudovirgaria hyperparasitica]
MSESGNAIGIAEISRDASNETCQTHRTQLRELQAKFAELEQRFHDRSRDIRLRDEAIRYLYDSVAAIQAVYLEECVGIVNSIQAACNANRRVLAENQRIERIYEEQSLEIVHFQELEVHLRNIIQEKQNEVSGLEEKICNLNRENATLYHASMAPIEKDIENSLSTKDSPDTNRNSDSRRCELAHLALASSPFQSIGDDPTVPAATLQDEIEITDQETSQKPDTTVTGNRQTDEQRRHRRHRRRAIYMPRIPSGEIAVAANAGSEASFLNLTLNHTSISTSPVAANDTKSDSPTHIQESSSNYTRCTPVNLSEAQTVGQPREPTSMSYRIRQRLSRLRRH